MSAEPGLVALLAAVMETPCPFCLTDECEVNHAQVDAEKILRLVGRLAADIARGECPLTGCGDPYCACASALRIAEATGVL